MISIKEISQRAGVSPGTVDRVLHNRGRVSKRTANRILSIVKKSHYKPNIYARNLSLARVYRFGVVMPKLAQDCGYWRIPAAGISRALSELEVHRASGRYFHYDRYSERSFQRAIAAAVKSNPDGLLIAPVLSSIAQDIIHAIPDGLPFVFFDSHVPCTKCLSTIGRESYPSGVLAGHLMHLLIHDRTSNCGGCVVALIKVLPNDVHIDERIKGFNTYMSACEDIHTVIREVDSNDGEAGFCRNLEALFAENLNLCGIFVSNAWTHPVASFLKNLVPSRRVHVIGYDIIPKNIQLLMEGLIDFLISPRPEMQGYLGINSLYRSVVLKETVRRRVDVPIDILTEENISYYRP